VTLRWGAFVPQGWKLELKGLDAAAAWAVSSDLARRAEAAGYDHLWVYDHVQTVPRIEPEHCFEAFTMLAALSQITGRVRLGQMVTCASYRNPALLAKQAACIDVMSRGRLICGLGAGWYHEEYAAYGYEFLSAGRRLAALEETIRAVRSLWTQERTTLDGKHVQLRDAHCDPKPIQKLPPVWVGGGGEKVTLAIAARHADATNWQVGLRAFIRKSEILTAHCERIGRDPATVIRTHAPDCMIFDDERAIRQWLDSPGGGSLWGGRHDVYLRDNFVGTPDQVAEKVQAYVDAGAREFVLWFRDYPSPESMERFMAEVVPRVKALVP